MSGKDYAQGAQGALACIVSVPGPVLSDSERDFFKASDPLGFILFQRNCDNPGQLRALVRALKETVGRDCPILIDQEGGRVQRLKPPHWRAYKPMSPFGEIYAQDKAHALEDLRFETLRLAEDLLDVGVNVNCAPVLDLLFDGAHDIIGDRAFSGDPQIVARLGLSVCRHFLKSGITPVIKHLPGHGRASVDSHEDLPRVEAPLDDLRQADFVPFREVAASDVGQAVWGMTAHILYPDIDSDRPVSLSDAGVKAIIREEIGFDGVLLCDDLDMKALDAYGTLPEKACAALDAGCDLALYCAGNMQAMEVLVRDIPPLREDTLARLRKAASPRIAAA